MRIDKNKQRIAAAATAEENLETRPTGRMNPPTEPEAFQAWLNDTRTKVGPSIIKTYNFWNTLSK